MPQSLRLTRRQLANGLIKRRIARTQEDADQIIKAVLADITDALRAEKVVMLNGFGTFQIKPTSERKIPRKIRTGEPFILPASRRVRFTASRQLLKTDP